MSDPPAAPPPRRVLFLVLPGAQLLDLGSPSTVFAANADGQMYGLVYCAPHTHARSAQPLTLSGLQPLPTPREHDVVLVTGPPVTREATFAPPLETGTLDWLRAAGAVGAMLGAVSTGAVVLAEAGLLDGRHCTVPPALLEVLRTRFPRARLQDQALLVHDRNVITSAGLLSGLDVALTVLEHHHGAVFAASVARRFAVPFNADGPSAHARRLVIEAHVGVRRVQDHLMRHTGEKASLPHLAELAGMSVRGLTQAFSCTAPT